VQLLLLKADRVSLGDLGDQTPPNRESDSPHFGSQVPARRRTYTA
jgi:hypothetical protein